MLLGTMKAKCLGARRDQAKRPGRALAGVAAACVWIALAHACGPDELPAFANPPPVDNGNDDGGVGDDAGDTQAR
jgi:hypothetical protein